MYTCGPPATGTNHRVRTMQVTRCGASMLSGADAEKDDLYGDMMFLMNITECRGEPFPLGASARGTTCSQCTRISPSGVRGSRCGEHGRDRHAAPGAERDLGARRRLHQG